MAAQYNLETLEITCPAGDTGLFVVDLLDAEDKPLTELLEGYAVFAVAQLSARGTLTTIVQRPIEVVDNTVTVRLSNRLTRKLVPGVEYRWDIRVVTSPTLSEDGQTVYCDADSDDVHSVYALRGEGLPVFKVPGVAVPVEGVGDYA